jgi:uncharacterized protein (TIGR00255 family)
LSVALEKKTPLRVLPNLSLVTQLKRGWDEIAVATGTGSGFSLELLNGQPDLFLYEEDWEGEEHYRKALEEAVFKALVPFDEMKQTEGKALKQEIELHLKGILKSLEIVVGKEKGAADKYRQKLIDRLKGVLPGDLEHDERILREVALFAEKVDIAEEIARFRSHVNQFKELIEGGEKGGTGKTLDFILQELFREANTMGSKSADIDITKAVISIKSDLERIREQVQNIE